MTSTSANLVKLLSREKLSMKFRIEPEQRLSIEVADWLRGMSLTGQLKAVFFHVPNESKRHIITAMILKAMGMLSGVSDFIFLWNDGSGVIELKVGKGKETENQLLFFDWCDSLGVYRATCRSLEDVQRTLKTWGLV